jgi:hypothetical protein
MKIWDISRVFCTSDITSPDSTPVSQNHVYAISDIIYNSPISVSNPTSSKPTRLGVDFQFFYNSYEIPIPTRFANNPPEFDPAANYHHLQLSKPCKPRLYTPQYTLEPPKITPEHDPSSGSESRFHKTFLGFFFILKLRAQIHLHHSISTFIHSLILLPTLGYRINIQPPQPILKIRNPWRHKFTYALLTIFRVFVNRLVQLPVYSTRRLHWSKLFIQIINTG